MLLFLYLHEKFKAKVLCPQRASEDAREDVGLGFPQLQPLFSPSLPGHFLEQGHFIFQYKFLESDSLELNFWGTVLVPT